MEEQNKYQVIDTGKPVEDKGAIYINITNKCNLSCPFCCMYSDPQKTSFMSFEKFKEIIDEQNKHEHNFFVQLEGGEPTIHPELILFITYLAKQPKLEKIVLLTNGVLLKEYRPLLPTLVNLVNLLNFKLEFKLSYNYVTSDVVHAMDLNMLEFAIRHHPNISMSINARARTPEEIDEIKENLRIADLSHISDIYMLRAYGRLAKSSNFEMPLIVPRYSRWELYASDGKCFGTDLVARSEHEKGLN